MGVYFALSLESFTGCIIDGTLTPQLLAISEHYVTVAHHSWTYLKSITAIVQVSYCRACLDRARQTLRCLQITILETLISVHNRNLHYKPSTCSNGRWSGCLAMGRQGRHPFHNYHLSSPNESHEQHWTPLIRQFDNLPYTHMAMVFVLDPRREVQQELRMGQLKRPQNLGVEDPGMTYSPVPILHTKADSTRDDYLSIHELAASITFTADVKMQSDWI